MAGETGPGKLPRPRPTGRPDPMASAFAHAFTAAALALAVTPGRWLPRLLLVAVVCSVLPDLDVVGFGWGVRYGDFLGHRGFSHSLVFAALTAGFVTWLCFRGGRWDGLRLRIALLLFVVTASHGLLDALTNGGLGVAFFSPFDDTRYFLPYRPVEVSPLGVGAFFTPRALPLLWTEWVWIGLPVSLLAWVLRGFVRKLEQA